MDKRIVLYESTPRDSFLGLCVCCYVDQRLLFNCRYKMLLLCRLLIFYNNVDALLLLQQSHSQCYCFQHHCSFHALNLFCLVWISGELRDCLVYLKTNAFLSLSYFGLFCFAVVYAKFISSKSLAGERSRASDGRYRNPSLVALAVAGSLSTQRVCLPLGLCLCTKRLTGQSRHSFFLAASCCCFFACGSYPVTCWS